MNFTLNKSRQLPSSITYFYLLLLTFNFNIISWESFFVLLATNHILSKRILYTKVGNPELSLEQVDDPLLLGSVLLYLLRSTGSTYMG